MRLSPDEEKTIKKEGILVTLLFSLILTITITTGRSMVFSALKEAEAIRQSAQQIHQANQRTANENKYLRDNQQTIETFWSTLKTSASGVNLNQLGALTQVGVTDNSIIPPFKIPGNPTDYAGVKLAGNHAEFQRLLDAIASVENSHGLLQVKTAALKLPPNAEPNALKPTFIDLQIEMVAPLTK